MKYYFKPYNNVITCFILVLYYLILYKTFIDYSLNNLNLLFKLDNYEYFKIITWIILLVLVLVYTIWLLFGRQTIIIEFGNLLVVKSLLGFSYKKLIYQIKDIEKCEIIDYYIYVIGSGLFSFNLLKKNCIKITLQKKTIFLGKYLTLVNPNLNLELILTEIKQRK